MDDLTPFVTSEMKILDSQRGDVMGDGSDGIVLILEACADGSGRLSNESPRETLLLVRDSAGQLQKVTSNLRLVPCKAGGGLLGDPYGQTHVERGQFTITSRGGGREHWCDEFTFAYAMERKGWFLIRVSRRVEDRETGRHSQIELVADDLGDIAFPDFDPVRLPEANLT